MDPRRSERVSEALREELEEIINYEMKDPRISIDGISEVLLSPDGRRASVRLTMSGNADSQEQTLEALNHAKGFLKIEVGSRLELFRVPDLHFEAAISAELAPRLGHLMKRIKKGRPRTE
jgi:ribosome-binding factor A